jgi:hypothetical protein
MGSRLHARVRALSQCTLLQIEERLGPALEAALLQKPATKEHSRQRIFSLRRTFWCWIWQVLQPKTSCREVVRQVQTLFALFSKARVDEATGAYCRARKKLGDTLLQRALALSYRSAQAQSAPCRLLQGRHLKIADGSSVRVADSRQNRRAFPPSKNQFEKPSFPIVKIVALFSARSGAILAKATGCFRQSELRLLMTLRRALAPEDIVAGDRHFGCFVLAAWLQSLQIDLIARLATRARNVDFRKALQRLGPGDGLFRWCKPAKPSPLFSRKQWRALPAQITVRIIRTRIARAGFRTRQLSVVTTLLDGALYPAQEVLCAYAKRWRMEMCLDDLKTTLAMEMLSCQSPIMIEKELLVFLTAHNLLRWMMAQAAQGGGVDLERLSFKGTLDGFRQWTAGLVQVHGAGKKRRQAVLWRQFLQTLVADLVPLRPSRKEPRAVKKRSKYPPLTKPRHRYVDRWSRNKRRRVANSKRSSSLK